MITLRYEITFVDETIGYSCWVHVSDDAAQLRENRDYAQHAGYVSPKHSATFARNKAHKHARDLHRVLRFANAPSRIVEGTHDLRAGEYLHDLLEGAA